MKWKFRVLYLGTISLALLFSIILTLAPRMASAQQADHTLESAFYKLYNWSVEAVGYDPFWWKNSVKEITDSLIGSTVQIDYLKLNSAKIKVKKEKASYSGRYDKSNTSEYLGWNFPKLRKRGMATDRYAMSEVGIDYFELTIADNSDRLATELSGTDIIKGVGRIKNCMIYISGISGYVQFEIELISWSKY
jgi:uncharacterized membrane protein